MAATRATEGEFLYHKQSVGGTFGGWSARGGLRTMHEDRTEVT
jgi:hypothetical protein